MSDGSIVLACLLVLAAVLAAVDGLLWARRSKRARQALAEARAQREKIERDIDHFWSTHPQPPEA